MTDILLGLFTGFWPYIIGGISVAGALIAGWLRAKSLGRAEQKAKQAAADAKAQTEAQKIDEAVAGRAPADNRERLGKWSR